MSRKVPNDKIRAIFEASPMSAADVARGMGWECSNNTGRSRMRGKPGTTIADSSRVKRTLGLVPDIGRKGHRTARERIDPNTAGQLAEAMGHGQWEALPDTEPKVTRCTRARRCTRCNNPTITIPTNGLCGMCIADDAMVATGRGLDVAACS